MRWGLIGVVLWVNDFFGIVRGDGCSLTLVLALSLIGPGRKGGAVGAFVSTTSAGTLRGITERSDEQGRGALWARAAEQSRREAGRAGGG